MLNIDFNEGCQFVFYKLGFVSQKEFEAQYGKEKAKKLRDSVLEWINYNDPEHIDEHLKHLVDNRSILNQVMNLTPSKPLYRGLTVDKEHALASKEIAATTPYRPVNNNKIESWTIHPDMAKSFATSSEWHQGKLKDYGVVVKLDQPKIKTILAPANETAPWFEKMIQNKLDTKMRKDRKSEDEYLVVGKKFNVTIHDKIKQS